jgi:4a-hydroxytetrahydrobiopterin dehydratase
MTPLHTRRCRPAIGDPLPAAEVERLLPQVAGWAVVDGGLQKVFAFTDYARMIAFVNAVAWLAQREDHHPELQVGWGRTTVRWRTHSVGGLSINDFICAAHVDALAP